MMYTAPSDNTKAILLLTAPLVAGGGRSGAKPLTPREYNRVAQRIREIEREPADLLGPDAKRSLRDLESLVDRGRLEALLDQGFALSQALEHWQARSIWVVSRADAEYPKRLKKRLGQVAPALFYGCGSPALWDRGGLAVVGSRSVEDPTLQYTETVGQLAAEASCTVISGGARGVDRAAMNGALEAGGSTVGVLPNNLDRAALNRGHREPLMDERLTLVSPFDPATRFFAGNAMGRNKLIYLLADAALVVAAEYGKGGTWSGASEQLEKYKAVSIYVARTGQASRGLRGLAEKGAMPWPEPANRDEFEGILDGASGAETSDLEQRPLPLDAETPTGTHPGPVPSTMDPSAGDPRPSAETTSARQLWTTVTELISRECRDRPKSKNEIAEALQVATGQADRWLKAMVEDGSLVRLSRPVRFQTCDPSGTLFGSDSPLEP